MYLCQFNGMSPTCLFIDSETLNQAIKDSVQIKIPSPAIFYIFTCSIYKFYTFISKTQNGH